MSIILKTPPIFQRIREVLNSYKIELHVDKVPSLKKAVSIQKILQAASIVSVHKDTLLEHKAKRLVMFARAHEWLARDGNPTSMLKIHLMCISGDLRGFRTSEQVKMIHALSLKLDLPNREWTQSRVMGLYAAIGNTSMAETIFLKEERKDIIMYNHMMFLYANDAPEKAHALFLEMVNTRRIPPTNVTFRGLLGAFSLSAKPKAPEKALRVLKSMKNYGVTPQFYHYGAVIDAFARIRTSLCIQEAVQLIKEEPVARNQRAFNAVLSRCIPTQLPKSAEDVLEVRKIIDVAQDLVDFLEENTWKYYVPNKTYWRLKDRKLKWPKGVKRKRETEEMDGMDEMELE